MSKMNICLVVHPGSGKTGTFLNVAYKYSTHLDNQFMIPYKKVFILTGMSDIDWEKQTQN